MKKNVSIITFVVITLVALIIVNVILHEPPSLTKEYINDNVLTEHYIEDILYSEIGDNYIFCLCSVDDNELMALVLKDNKSYYGMQSRYSFTLNSLTENATEIIDDKTPFTDAHVLYNVFLNPTEDKVVIDGAGYDVNTLTYNGYKLGFWWTECE